MPAARPLRRWIATYALVFVSVAFAQSSSPLDNWHAVPAETISVDRTVAVDGKASIRLQRDQASAKGFSVITRSMPIDFAGKRIELRGKFSIRDVDGAVGLWLREDGPTGTLEFDNMDSQHIAGTRDWADYSVSLPVNAKATTLLYGVLLSGTGTAWTQEPQLFVDGMPIAKVTHVERKKSVLETDTEFADGSRIRIDKLSDVQLENLVTLGEVWGFLKYFHPAVTTGTRQWDFDLFRVMPKIIEAQSRDAANRILLDWTASLGPVKSCAPCAKPGADAQLHSPTLWIRDDARLGKALSGALVHIYENRMPDTQFYVSKVPSVGNPVFDNELVYDKIQFPDAGYALLAGYRFWAMIEYWYPYRDLSGDWPQALRDSVPELASAIDGAAYDRSLLKLIARVQDTHANLWSSLDARPPGGDCKVPIGIRFIDADAVVDDVTDTGPRRGDVIVKIDDVPVAERVTRWSPYYAASNEPTRLRDIGRSLTRGACGAVSLDIDRAGSAMKIAATRIPANEVDRAGKFTHDLPGDTFRLLTPDIAYMKLSSIKAADVPGYINAAAHTKGLIIDIRNYPSEFVVFALGSLLVDRQTPFARFSIADLSNPGEFAIGEPVVLEPKAPHYDGKVIVLVDEVSVSQAEYTAMALRASPRAIVIGSTTAGADGNVSMIALPGKRRTAISGIGVFYPDKRRTQQIGIVPDIVVKPTIAGIRDGKDEVLERAISELSR
jgi:C-terminal processing protease CtpA/Prc